MTIRKVPRGLLFWPSTDENRTQANAIAQRLQSARKPPQTTRQKRGGHYGDIILNTGRSEGLLFLEGISGWQQPFAEERCDGYATLPVRAPC
jgi:hypothetical protein